MYELGTALGKGKPRKKIKIIPTNSLLPYNKTMQSGYSGKSLIDKLGLKPSMTAFFFHEPETYKKEISDILPHIKPVSHLSPTLDFIHGFFTNAKDFEQHFPKFKEALASDGLLWISWPK